MLAQLASIASVVLEVIKLVRQIKLENKEKIAVQNDVEKLKIAFKERDADKLNELFGVYTKKAK